MGEYVYQNDVLQFINHEEGRIAMAITQPVFSDDASAVTNYTASNVSLSAITQNGNQTYVKATSTGTVSRSGVFPVGGTINVVAGERYIVRAKGYRDKGTASTSSSVFIAVKLNGADLIWKGAALPDNYTSETWTEQIVDIPTSGTMQVGITWNTVLAGEVMYINDFEVTKLKTQAAEYQYHLKDHLGNVRVTFTTTPPTTTTTPTGFETANQTTEAAFFTSGSYQASKISTVSSFATTGTNSYYLNGGSTGIVGPTKTFSVMPGDQVSISAKVKYTQPNTGIPSNVGTNIVSALLTAFNVTAGTETGIGLTSYGNWDNGNSTALVPLLGTGDEQRNDAIKAFVTIILFDRSHNVVDVTYQAVQANGSMTVSYTVKQPGYAYLYFSNEHPYQTDMYFDDVTITYTPSAIVQQEDFYPFGLKFNSYVRESSVPNNLKLFQGQEHIDDLGLNWDQFKWRNHMPDIGRFFNIDPLSEKYVYNSTYAFSENKVTAHREIEGLESAIAILDKEIANVEGAVNTMVSNVSNFFGRVSNSIANVFSSERVEATQNSSQIVEQSAKGLNGEGTFSKTAGVVGKVADAIEVTEKVLDPKVSKSEVALTVSEKVVSNVTPLAGNMVSVVKAIAADGKNPNGLTAPGKLAASYRIMGGQNFAAVAARIQAINQATESNKQAEINKNKVQSAGAIKE